MEIHTSETPKAGIISNIPLEVAKGREPSSYIEQFGSSTTDQYQMGATFTI